MNFPCTKCGACCQGVSALVGLPEKPDGSCRYLNPDNTCAIYEDRPDFCRIEDWEDFEWIAIHCNKLQEDHGLPKSLRVIIPSDKPS